MFITCYCLSQVLNKAEIIKENAVQQCKDEVNIQVRIIMIIIIILHSAIGECNPNLVWLKKSRFCLGACLPRFHLDAHLPRFFVIGLDLTIQL